MCYLSDRSGVTSVKVGQAELNILLYADDMVIMAYNVFDLQSKINIVRSYLELNDLVVNLAKTKVVIFRIGNEVYASQYRHSISASLLTSKSNACLSICLPIDQPTL
jgi:hypothetical protein